MSSREQYTISGQTLEQVITSLNFVMQRIADRLDKLEGIRGKTAFVGEGLDVEGDVLVKDTDEETIHSME